MDDGEALALLTYGTTNPIEAIDNYRKSAVNRVIDEVEVRKILDLFKKHKLLKKYTLKIKMINPAIGHREIKLKMEV